MTVTFLAVAKGVHEVGGLWMESGTIATRKLQISQKCGVGASTSWQKISFTHPFTATPAFLTSVQTVNNENGLPHSSSQPFFAVAVNSVKTAEAWVSLEMAETSQYGGNQVDQDEVVGYIAIQKGSATLQDSTTGTQVKMAAAVSGSTVKGWQNGKYSVNLPTSLPVSTPLALASQNTRRGADGGWARLRGAGSDHVKVSVEEDKSCDTERSHTQETMSVCAFAGPCIL